MVGRNAFWPQSLWVAAYQSSTLQLASIFSVSDQDIFMVMMATCCFNCAHELCCGMIEGGLSVSSTLRRVSPGGSTWEAVREIKLTAPWRGGSVGWKAVLPFLPLTSSSLSSFTTLLTLLAEKTSQTQIFPLSANGGRPCCLSRGGAG